MGFVDLLRRWFGSRPSLGDGATSRPNEPRPTTASSDPSRGNPLLSKSRYTAGLQCLKRLYLESYEVDLATPPGPGQESLFAAGTSAGSLAQQLYPGGVLVEEDHRHHPEATARTHELLRDPAVRALYEAAFTEDDIRIRADILVRGDDETWNLVEVKSATSVKDQYIDDVAVQLHVLAHAGDQVDRASVAFINNQYVYAGGEYSAGQLFEVEDVTDLARERLAGVPARLAEIGARSVQLNDTETFALTTSGGTSIEIPLRDPSLIKQFMGGSGQIPTTRAEKAIQTVRKMLREKKTAAG